MTWVEIILGIIVIVLALVSIIGMWFTYWWHPRRVIRTTVDKSTVQRLIRGLRDL